MIVWCERPDPPGAGRISFHSLTCSRQHDGRQPDPHDQGRRRGHQARAEALEDRRTTEKRSGNLYGPRPWRPPRERRVPRGQGEAVAHRRPHPDARGSVGAGGDHRGVQALRRAGDVRRHRQARGHRVGPEGAVHHRRRDGSGSEEGPDQHHQPDRPRPDRTRGGRHREDPHARRRARVRGAGSAVPRVRDRRRGIEVSQGDPGLSLALSPLLQPLRFATRAGVSRLIGLEALVAKVVDQARAYASEASAARLEKLAQSVRGFDESNEADRERALAALVRELGALLPIPLEISALARSVSEGSGKLAAMPVQTADPKAPRDPLSTPVIQLRGVGPAIAEKLEAKGLRTVGDLLLNLPRKYEDRRTPRTVAEAPIGERSVIAGKILKAQEARGRRRRLEVLVRDAAGGTLVCIWFHYRPNMLDRFRPFAQALVSGEVREG